MKKISRFIRILLVLSCQAYGNATDTVLIHKNPVYVQVQYAGNMGLVSAGIGTSFFSEKLSVCLIYGYLPKSMNDVTVHTIALKSSVRLFHHTSPCKKQIECYTGITLLRGITKNTYLLYPQYYPKDYYPPNAYHFALFTGAKHSSLIKNNPWFERIGAFVELGTIDYKVIQGLHSKYIGFFDLWNVSFGVSLYFLRK
jgi:hypothetical protein